MKGSCKNFFFIIYLQGLAALLNESVEGRELLKHTDELSKKDRRSLVAIVVDYLFKHHYENSKY